MTKLITPKLIVQTLLFSGIAFLILAIPTAVVANPYFTRMTPVYWFDYLFLVVNSLLIGLYFGMSKISTNKQVCAIEKRSIGAQVLAYIGVACPICNKILVLLFSSTFLLGFLEPIRPYLSLLSSLMLVYLIARKVKLAQIVAA